MRHLILNPRNHGMTLWRMNAVQRAFVDMFRQDLGVQQIKLQYGLVPMPELPWWMKPEDVPIRDPRRLLPSTTTHQ